jgi:hypothetical protein
VTVICSGNTSTQRPGFSTLITIGTGQLESLLEGLSMGWAVAYFAAIGILTYDLTVYCASDPPAQPTITPGDLISLLLGPLSGGADYLVAVQKFRDLAGNLLWPTLCMCNVVGTPAATPVAEPAGAPDNNPLPSPTVQPCQELTPTGVGVTNGNSHTLQVGVIPKGATTWTYTWQTVATVAPGPNLRITMDQQQSTGPSTFIVVKTDNLTISPGNKAQLKVAIDPRADQWAVSYTGVGGAAGTSRPEAWPGVATWAPIDFYCNGDLPGTTVQPCCPPDTISTGLLQQILQLVTLMQRQAVPFATVHGAVHSGLTGDGSFAVQGILGLSASVTTRPSRVGGAAGTPETIFDVGWINVGTADGYGPRHFITSTPFLVGPVAGDVTVVGYSIPGDVVVSITELVREA